MVEILVNPVPGQHVTLRNTLVVGFGDAEVGIKESGIICIFHQSGKGHKRKGAETEKGRNGKRHKGTKHNSFCFKPESGTKESSIKKRGIIQFVQNRKVA
jgi:hypothetical protein